VVTERDGPLTFGRPHPPDDRLQPDAVFVGGPDLNRLVRVLGRFLGDSLLQLFLNASRSSGVAEAGWRGRGRVSLLLIAGCDSPIIAAATDTFRISIRASKARSKLRSNAAIFIS